MLGYVGVREEGFRERCYLVYSFLRWVIVKLRKFMRVSMGVVKLRIKGYDIIFFFALLLVSLFDLDILWNFF